MEVVLLGTGSPLPSPDRAGPATLVRAGEFEFLFDTGRGVLMRLTAAGSNPVRMGPVFLTHLHSDHTTDFNDIVTTRWIIATKPLPVIGPPGTAEYCDLTLAMLQRDISWRIEHHEHLNEPPSFEVTEIEDGICFDEGGVRVIAAPTEHAPVKPTVGFRVEHEGKSVVIGGDGIPCEGLDRLCAGADAYVQTVLRTPLIPPRLHEILTYHSSTEDAAQTAKRCGVRKLVFTHQIPAPLPGTEQDWLNDAKQHYSGEVVMGTDLQVVEV